MKKKKSLVVLFSIFGIFVIGLTIAYFTNMIDIENIFKTKQYGTIFYEEFISPDNWIPGTTTDKMVYAENTGEIDEAVRISYTEVWTNSNGEELSGLIDSNGNEVTNMENIEHAAILNLVNDEYWIKDGDYYYYKYKLNPGDLTGSFLESVTFNKNVNAEYNCDSYMNSETQMYLDCDSTKTGYNNAKYKLTFKVETVQYDKYKEAWNTNVDILEPFNIKGLPVNPPVITMNEQTKRNLFTFHHEATEQTPALTDYRYIGDNPNNYVYFNCDDDNDTSTCEIWRIIGVFDVEDGTGNYVQRIKIVRGNSLPLYKGEGYDWNNSPADRYLNEDYMSELSESAQSMIGDTKYYLGGYIPLEEQNWTTGNADEIYSWERGNITFNESGYCKSYPNSSDCMEEYSNNWIGKISYLYLSDAYYNYANGIDNECFENPRNCYQYEYNAQTNKIDKERQNPGYPQKGWIYNSNMADQEDVLKSLQLLSPSFSWYDTWSIMQYNGGANYMYDNNYRLRPTLYLKVDVDIVSGDGSINNPYKLYYNSSNDNNYKLYKKGEIVSYDNNDYYVIRGSSIYKDYITLLKKDPLTAEQINQFSNNYVSINGEYPFYEHNDCNEDNRDCIMSNNSNDYYNFYTDYDNSDIKELIDNWSSQYDNFLIELNGYKARLVNKSELQNEFGYEVTYDFNDSISANIYEKTEKTLAWIYFDDIKYWSEYNRTQYDHYDNINGVTYERAFIYCIGEKLSPQYVFSKFYVRPVINLKKCAIDNTCE